MDERYLYRGKPIENVNLKWVYGSLIQCGISGKCYVLPQGNDANESDKVGCEGCLMIVTYEVDPATIGQCTGLKDKNGVLIFESDIVKNKTEKYEIVWRESSFYRLAKDGRLLSFTKHTALNCEKIGNIYDKDGEPNV